MTSESTQKPEHGIAEEDREASPVEMSEQLAALVAEAQSARANAKAAESEAREVIDQLNELLRNAKALFGELEEEAPKLVDVSSEIDAQRVSITTQAEQVGEAQTRATEIRGELEKILASAQKSEAAVTALKQSVDEYKDAASQADTAILTVKSTVDENAKAIKEALGVAKTSSAAAKNLADKAGTIEQRIQAYEEGLDALNAQCEEQLEAIKSLLPGATSAGLASAFDSRRRTFIDPGKRWERIFIGTVIALVAVSSFSLIQVYIRDYETNSQIFVFWLSRVPVAAALVWLAMHASRESALAKRLEEDYGFKVSVASSFQGFQEQMKSVGGFTTDNEPLKALCDATLAQILNPPGRIYEKHALAVSPTSELLQVIQPASGTEKATRNSSVR